MSDDYLARIGTTIKEARHRAGLSQADLATERQSPEPALLGAFQRWSDPAWRGGSPIRR